MFDMKQSGMRPCFPLWILLVAATVFFFSFPKFTWDGQFQDGDFWGTFFLLFWRENGTLVGNSHLSTGGVALQQEHLRIPSRSWPTSGVCVCLTSVEQLFLMPTVHTGSPALKNLNNSKAILPGFWDFLSPALSALQYVLVLGSEVLMRGWVTAALLYGGQNNWLLC